MASNPNLNLAPQQYPSSSPPTLKPVQMSPIIAKLAAAVAAVRAQRGQTKPSSQFLP